MRKADRGRALRRESTAKSTTAATIAAPPMATSAAGAWAARWGSLLAFHRRVPLSVHPAMGHARGRLAYDPEEAVGPECRLPSMAGAGWDGLHRHRAPPDARASDRQVPRYVLC